MGGVLIMLALVVGGASFHMDAWDMLFIVGAGGAVAAFVAFMSTVFPR